MKYEFTIPITPVAKGRARFDSRTKRTYTPTKTRKAEQDIRYFLDMQWKGKAPLTGALCLIVTFFFLRPKSVSAKKRPHHIVKPDASNLLKVVEDSGNGLLWCDDSQIIMALCHKEYGDTEGIQFSVEEVP